MTASGLFPKGDIFVDCLLAPGNALNPRRPRCEPVAADCRIAGYVILKCAVDDKEPLLVFWVPVEKDAVVAMGDKHVAGLGLLYLR